MLNAPHPARGTSRLAARIRDRVRRDGIRSTAAAEAHWLGHRLFVREEHVWYQLDLAPRPESPSLPEGVRLVLADDAQLDALAGLGQSPRLARQNRARGHEVWLALEDDEALYTCSIFRGELPVLAAPNGVLELPAGVVAGENAVARRGVRGTGLEA